MEENYENIEELYVDYPNKLYSVYVLGTLELKHKWRNSLSYFDKLLTEMLNK